MFFAVFDPGVSFFGPLFSRKFIREKEVAKQLYLEADKQTKSSEDADSDVKCIYASK